MSNLRGLFRLPFWLLIVVAIVLPSCGQNVNYPSPTLKSISPTSTTTNQTNPFVLTVIGSNFVQQSNIQWNSTPLSTTFVNTGQLTAIVPPSFYAAPGTAMITVVTPQPGGGTTQAITFSVGPTVSPVPHISSLSPSGVLTGGGGFTLRVFGSNFVQQSTVAVNGSNRQSGYVNSTEIDASLNSTDIATAGILQITVINPVNPPPGGGASNSYPLSILNPLPTITGVAPAGVQAGGTPTTLSLTGTGFVNQSSFITVNGTQRPTTFVSATQVTTPLTGSDLLVGGVNQVQVVNSTPGGGPSNTLTFAVNPTHLLGLPILVDLAADGSQANEGICGGLSNCENGTLGLKLTTVGPSTSTTGHYVAFASVSNNLILNEPNNGGVVFVRNTCLGVASCTPATTAVSTDPNGNAANGASSEPSLDGAASDAAFTSLATNLVTSVGVPAGMSQVYWRPVCLPTSTTAVCNVTPTTFVTQLVSVSADGLTAGNGDSYNPSISPDGRYVAFVSLATNLVSGISPDGVTPQVYLRDTCSGVTGTTCIGTTYLISTDGTTPGNGASSNPSTASGGLYVSFTSVATNLGASAPNEHGSQEVFERSTCLTDECTANTTLISTHDGVTPADGASSESSISNTGRFIVFASTGTTLVTGAGPTQQIYLRDTCIAIVTACMPSTTLISLTTSGVPGNGTSEYPSINSTGQYVAFASFSSNIASTTNGVENIFARNTCETITTECTTSTVLVTQGAGSGATPANGNSLVPSISQDGTTVSLLSFADNLVPRDNNGLEDIFLGSTTFTASTTTAEVTSQDVPPAAEVPRSVQ
ncbi:MAG: hypothetical protein WCD49_06925 [Candidatus Acidiferrales bacterium]